MTTANALLAAVAAGEEHIDRTHSWIWPEGYEIWFGSIASIIVFALLIWKAGPIVKKAMTNRTERVQYELDSASQAEADAGAEAERIRAAKGDIEAERARLLADADQRATALLADGRDRLERDVAEMETKARADIASAGSRTTDELRSEIARSAARTAELVVERSLDDEEQQRLVEEFIADVGRTGASA